MVLAEAGTNDLAGDAFETNTAANSEAEEDDFSGHSIVVSELGADGASPYHALYVAHYMR